MYSNQDLENLITPVDVDALELLLKDVGYDKRKTDFLVDGFRNGFTLSYEGSWDVKLESPNLKFSIENKVILWNKTL